MTATAVPVTIWAGCYADGWQDLIVPEAFAHPAKFARGLIHRIYRHLIEQGYVREGDTVLDPFGGVGLGALDAMTYGLRYIGVELEPRFVALAQQNLALWRQRYGFTGGTVVQGDSRRLREVLAGAQVGCVVGSPPYAESLNSAQNGIDRQKSHTPGGTRISRGAPPETSYGHSTGQLGAMPPGRLACVSSPPYESSLSTVKPDIAEKLALAQQEGMTASRARWGWNKGSSGMSGDIYGTSPAQLGNTSGDTFWAASALIMTELAALLPPGAVCAWVLKAYVSKKAIVPFPDQWRALCEAHGFTLVEEIHASLVEHHGTQEGLFEGPQDVTTEKKSFFRRLAEKKGSPRIDYETVLIVQKAGDTGGVCVVSSPPFHQNGLDCRGYGSSQTVSNSDRAWVQKWEAGAREPSVTSYGTTPGNLGNMPVGVCVVSSPPWHNSQEGASVAGPSSGMWKGYEKGFRPTDTGPIYASSAEHYGTTPGNLGNMPVEKR